MKPNETKSKTNKPIQEILIGAVKASVWVNEVRESGFISYKTTFRRLYKDGDQWKMTDSFGRDDLLALAKVADQVHTWIVNQRDRED